MRALTVIPEQPGSAAVTDVAEPGLEQGDVLVDGLAIGVCGTDREIIAGEYGQAPAGRERLVLGHESLGVVEEPSPDGDFVAGDLVVGIVRRPDPVPCDACARGEFDMCRNGLFKERGINQLDGYGSERWRVESDYCVKLDPGLRSVGMLMEPTTVVAKAVEQMQRIGEAMRFEPRRMLVTGRRADRPARRDARGPARPRGPRPRPGHRRAQAPARRGPRRDLPLRATSPRRWARPAPTRSSRRQASANWSSTRWITWPRRGRLPDRHLADRRDPLGGSRLDQPRPRPPEQRRARLGQRQPTPLPGGSGGSGGRRPLLARAPDHPQGAAGELRGSAGNPARRRQGRDRDRQDASG